MDKTFRVQVKVGRLHTSQGVLRGAVAAQACMVFKGKKRPICSPDAVKATPSKAIGEALRELGYAVETRKKG